MNIKLCISLPEHLVKVIRSNSKETGRTISGLIGYILKKELKRAGWKEGGSRGVKE